MRHKRSKVWLTAAALLLCMGLSGCQKKADTTGNASLIYTDALGAAVEFSDEELAGLRDGSYKIAVLQGSFAEIWSIAGGKLSAVTEDAYDDTRDIHLEENTINAGALKSPSVELLLEADIKLAILSADIEEHVALKGQLEKVGIKTLYHSVETFEDYLEVLKLYTDMTGQEDCYEKYGASVEREIAGQIDRQDGSEPSVLFIRAYSTGAKAKGSDSMTGIMLKELGCVNIADGDSPLKDDLSMEIILQKNPDYIFVTTMGADEEEALESVDALLKSNPAWNTLSAVKDGHYYVLPKNMFHNKPNQRWAESYRMLADYLYD